MRYIAGDLERFLSRDSRRSRDDILCTENTEELVVIIYILPIKGATIHVNNFRERMYKRTSVKSLKRIVC